MMPGTEIRVKYKETQGSEDLFVCKEGKRKGRVYARQRMNIGDRVQWFTTIKWQGGYEADCHIRAGFRMIVVDRQDQEIFEETLETDEWNSGTSAKKNGLFLDEWLRKIEEEIAEKNNLVSYEEWKQAMIEDKNQYGNNEYNDTWMYGYSETLSTNRLKGYEYIDGPVFVYRDKMKHRLSGRKWTQYEIRKQGDDICLGLCGFEI